MWIPVGFEEDIHSEFILSHRVGGELWWDQLSGTLHSEDNRDNSGSLWFRPIQTGIHIQVWVRCMHCWSVVIPISYFIISLDTWVFPYLLDLLVSSKLSSFLIMCLLHLIIILAIVDSKFSPGSILLSTCSLLILSFHEIWSILLQHQSSNKDINFFCLSHD